MFRDKIWVHRVNSIEKLEKVNNHYIGVELDVVFKIDSLVFDIYHPPQESKQVYLKDYFPKSKTNLQYWLDYKNLTQENAIISSKYLEKLVKENTISPNDIIVESPEIEHLVHFKNKGFRTSYYLPSNLKTLNKENLLHQLQNIQNSVKKYPPTMVSSNSKDYTIMKDFFPDQKKNLWILANLSDLSTFKNRISLYRRLLDPSVEIILIKVK